jgi:predicted ATPase
MVAVPKPRFLITELDPGLLSAPFGVDTSWHVITGAPCCGKTTLIEQFARKGFQTVPEIGRAYIEREMARGRTIDDLRGDEVSFQRGIREMQLAMERGLRAQDVAFLDRAYPDCLSFCRLTGLNPNLVLADCFHHRYASVFVLDILPYQHDGVRTESDAEARFLDEWLARDYRALGYDVLRVPVLPPAERLAFVLDRLFDADGGRL